MPLGRKTQKGHVKEDIDVFFDLAQMGPDSKRVTA